MLLKAGVVSELQLQAGLAEQQRWGGKLGQILVRMGVLSDELLAMALARQLNLPRANLDALEAVPASLRERLDRATCERYRIVPLAWVAERRSVQLAMSDPLDVVAVDNLRRLLGTPIEIFIATDQQVEAALRRLYSAASSTVLSRTDGVETLDIMDNTGNVRLVATRPPEPAAPARVTAPPTSPPMSVGGSFAAQVEEHRRLLRAVVELLAARGLVRPGELGDRGGGRSP
jgi:hypothetical protein